MRDFISSKMSTIGLSGIRKVNEKALAMEREGKTVIHFEIGRPDFDTPEYIKKAAKESLDRGEVFYTSNLGDMGLRKQIGDLQTEKHRKFYADSFLIKIMQLAGGISADQVILVIYSFCSHIGCEVLIVLNDIFFAVVIRKSDHIAFGSGKITHICTH